MSEPSGQDASLSQGLTANLSPECEAETDQVPFLVFGRTQPRIELPTFQYQGGH